MPPIFLHLDPRISLDMSSYMGTEGGGGSTVTVCAVLGNVVAMTVGGPEVTTSDIMTTFNLTDGLNASKNTFFQFLLPPLPLKAKGSFSVTMWLQISQRTTFLLLDLSATCTCNLRVMAKFCWMASYLNYCIATLKPWIYQTWVSLIYTVPGLYYAFLVHCHHYILYLYLLEIGYCSSVASDHHSFPCM